MATRDAGCGCAIAVAFVGAFMLLTNAASAGYILTPLSEERSSIAVQPGGSFRLDVMLSSTSNDRHDASLFRVEFSAPGLILTGFSWAPPYSEQFDFSVPSSDALPLPITESLLSGEGYPSGVADIEFSNLTDTGEFAAGRLLSAFLRVPQGWGGDEQITIRLVPDQFSRGFEQVPVHSAATLLVSIPSPSTLAGVVAIGALVSARRRQTRHSVDQCIGCAR